MLHLQQTPVSMEILHLNLANDLQNLLHYNKYL